MGKSCGFGASRVRFGSLLGAWLLIRVGSEPLWVYRTIIALIFIESCVDPSRWPTSLPVPVLCSSLLVLLLSLKLADPACYPSHA